MGLLKIVTQALFKAFLLFIVLSAPPLLAFSIQPGKILFLIQQGQHKEAIKLYRQYYQEKGSHDFELIHRMGIGILNEGAHQPDPEIQLLALFGASVSAHEEACPILEESLNNPHPEIQLVALQAIARLQYDRADQLLNRALGSDFVLIRLEAALQLCKKKQTQAVAQVESLMYKTPKVLLPIYPELYATAGTPHAIRLMRKLLNHPSEHVRVAVILSAAKHGRDDLLPQIRQQASHLNYKQQEASAYALGVLKDDQSLSRLLQLTQSKYSSVVLAAEQALYTLGQKEAAQVVRKKAEEGDLFAIRMLGDMPEEKETLITLLNQNNLNIRINATLSLLEQHDPHCLPYLKDILMTDKRDLAFTEINSPGKALTAWKATSSASQILKDDTSAYLSTIELKEDVLNLAKELPELYFLQLAEDLFNRQQNILVPTLVTLLEELGTESAIALLKHYQQKPGAPLIRQYCNLALYRLNEPGPYGELLRQWVKNKNDQDMIQFRPFDPWESTHKHAYQLTPEETSRLLVEAFQAFTIKQDEKGLEALLEAIENGHAKNKYALAGLLLRATQ